MNIVHICDNLTKKIKKIFQLLYFFLIQKPIYCLSYNGDGNQFSCKGYLLNSSVLITGRNNRLIIKEGCRLCNTSIVVSGEGNVVILDNRVVFTEGGKIRVEDNRNRLLIGKDSNMINCFFSISDDDSKIEIGKECLFSANVIVRNSDSHSILNNEDQRINFSKDVIIGDHVWLAYGVTILKGCVIGQDSIVGSNSLLSNFNGDPNSIIVGNPAKCVKTGVNWDVNRIPR